MLPLIFGGGKLMSLPLEKGQFRDDIQESLKG